MLYQPAPVHAVQVARPFAEIVRLLPGTAALKCAGERYTVGILVPERADAALAGTGRAAMAGDWVVTRPNGSYDLLTDVEFRQVRGFMPVSHDYATAA